MSHFRSLAWHPVKQRPEPADWYDGYFGGRRYGVRFDGEDKVYPEEEVRVPNENQRAAGKNPLPNLGE